VVETQPQVACPGQAIGIWKYQASVTLTPAQVAVLSDPNQVDLPLLARRVLHAVGHLWVPPLQPAHVPLHRQVAVAVTMQLDQVLPDPLRAQPLLQGLLDVPVVGRRRRSWPGDLVWPVLIRLTIALRLLSPGDRVGRFDSWSRAYRPTVSRCTSSSCAIRRWLQRSSRSASICCCVDICK
jgi:hypothetical protein